MKPSPPLTVTLRRSRIALVTVVVAYGATASLIAMLPGPPWLRVFGALCVAGAGAWTLRNRARQAPIDIALGLDRSLRITRGGRVEGHGTALGDSYVGPWLTTIVWLPEGARLPRALMIVRDAIAPESFRQLRVVLRYGSTPADRTSAVDAG